MKYFRYLTLLSLFFITTDAFAAADCDFNQPTGSCHGSITVNKTGGSKPSFSAEITVSSSAPTCSKVEYYLDNTPNTTVLKNTNSEPESLFGTSPISSKNIQVKSCTAYLDNNISQANGAANQGSQASNSGRRCSNIIDLKATLEYSRDLVNDAGPKLELAYKYRREELAASKVNRAYAAEMDQYIATWEPQINDAKEYIRYGEKCMADKKCIC